MFGWPLWQLAIDNGEDAGMRFWIKFLVVSGLCGFGLSCLIGLAEEGSAPALSAPGSPTQPTEPSEPAAEGPPKKYSRSRGAEELQAEAVPGASQAGPVRVPPGQPFVPVGAELPPNADAAAQEAWMLSQLEQGLPPESQPTVIPEDVQAFSESPIGSFSQAAEAFSPSPAPTPEGNPPAANPAAVAPASPTVIQLPFALQGASLPAANPPAPTEQRAVIAVEPTTGPQTAMVSLEWVNRTEVNVGQECQCDLVVKNTGDTLARSVSVHVGIPATARLLPKTKPAPLAPGNQLHWQLGDLAPKQSKTIQLHLVPTTRADLTTSAFVHFGTAAAESKPSKSWPRPGRIPKSPRASRRSASRKSPSSRPA
jgi:hypothetical protein